MDCLNDLDPYSCWTWKESQADRLISTVFIGKIYRSKIVCGVNVFNV